MHPQILLSVFCFLLSAETNGFNGRGDASSGFGGSKGRSGGFGGGGGGGGGGECPFKPNYFVKNS